MCTSGIFFSSTKTIDSSEWHMINSTAPAPNHKREAVKLHEHHTKLDVQQTLMWTSIFTSLKISSKTS